MYFVARRVSLPSVENMIKKEKAGGKEIYLNYSRMLNELINTYFSIESEKDMEIQIAGSEQERNEMMPLQYLGTHREKNEVESDIRTVLASFHDGMAASSWLDVSNRMKPLDVCKVLMGIRSTRESVKRFEMNANVWAKRQDYSYDDIFKVCEMTVHQFYMENLPQISNPIIGNDAWNSNKGLKKALLK